MYLLCSTVVLLARRRFTRETEGVGFEPTVQIYPVESGKSSELNRPMHGLSIRGSMIDKQMRCLLVAK
jgi:hypothetical protein